MVKLLDKTDWMVRLDLYPKVLETGGWYTHNMNVFGNDRTKEYGYWYNIIGKETLKRLKGKEIPFPFDIYIKDGDVDNVPDDRIFSIYSFESCHSDDNKLNKCKSSERKWKLFYTKLTQRITVVAPPCHGGK